MTFINFLPEEELRALFIDDPQSWVAEFVTTSSHIQLRPLVHEIVALPAAYTPDHPFF